ncbi:MAG: LysR family transcriptional regulator [Bacteroidota bacterium]
MNFQQLKYILAVEKFQNFNRAAIACDVAQSTLSKEIQRLEQEYQIIIFDRTRNPVVPTLKGIDLLRKAREILFHQNEFVQIAKKKNNEVAGNMTLAITEILAPYLAPLFLHRLIRKYPDLELKVLELSDRRIEDLLIEGAIDAAVMISPALSHDYYEHKLFWEEVMLYATQPIETAYDNKINLSDVNFDTILIHKDLQVILQRQIKEISEKVAPYGVSNIEYLKGNLETLKNIVQHNGGSMLLPQLAIPYFPAEQQKNIYGFRDIQPKLEVSLIASRGFEKNRIIKKLIKELQRTVPQTALIR